MPPARLRGIRQRWLAASGLNSQDRITGSPRRETFHVRTNAVRVALILPVFIFAATSQVAAQSRQEFDRRRQKLVSEFIEKEGVHNPRVLEAMRTVPRHEFVPASLRSKAYEDAAFLIGYKQTISPPFVVAYMTQAIDPQPSDRVLEIGTGSGYQAAILSRMVKEVYTIEIVEPLGRAAEKRLQQLGYTNVKTKVGDGYLGWPEHAPFDKIIVTCSPESVPQPLVDQLKEGGRMVIPLGERYHQDMYLLEKKDGKLVRQHLIPTLFVPMTGRSEKRGAVKPDPLHPRLLNGGFEAATTGRASRRLALPAADGAGGERSSRGRIFRSLRKRRSRPNGAGAAGDGDRWTAHWRLRFTLKVRPTRVVDGVESYHKASLQVFFYDEARRPMGESSIPSWKGTSDWQTVDASVPVPLGAREAIIRLGLNGATGRLDVDDVGMSAERRQE